MLIMFPATLLALFTV